VSRFGSDLCYRERPYSSTQRDRRGRHIFSLILVHATFNITFCQWGYLVLRVSERSFFLKTECASYCRRKFRSISIQCNTMQYPERSGGVAISSLRSGCCNGPANAIHCNSRVLMNGKNMGLFIYSLIPSLDSILLWDSNSELYLHVRVRILTIKSRTHYTP